MTNYFYLPEQHNFKYVATAPWPIPQPQIDWVDQVLTMEYWLDRHIGPHHARWAWARIQEQRAWEACVAFKYDKHKTLFLLAWA